MFTPSFAGTLQTSGRMTPSNVQSYAADIEEETARVLGIDRVSTSANKTAATGSTPFVGVNCDAALHYLGENGDSLLSNGREALLLDIGSVDNLTGGNFMRRQSAKMIQENYPPHAPHKLDIVKRIGGVGHGTQECEQVGTVWGVLEDGETITYAAPVIEGSGAECPPLLGLGTMQQRNSIIGTKDMMLIQLPQDVDVRKIDWGPGPKVYQCEKGHGGHMMLPISHVTRAKKPPGPDIKKHAQSWLSDKPSPPKGR